MDALRRGDGHVAALAKHLLPMDWCADEFSGDGPETLGSRLVNPTAGDSEPASKRVRVFRGGAWSYGEIDTRLASRSRNRLFFRLNTLSFRLARTVP